MNASSNSVSYTDRFNLRRTGSKRDSDRGRTALNSVNQEVGRSENYQQETERRSSDSLVTPLVRQVSGLQLRSDYQPPVTLQRRSSGRGNRSASWHQRQAGERVEYTAWQNQGGNNQGYYSVRGVSANSSRGQFVYFNCFTTTPVSLHLNSTSVSMDVPNGYLNNHRYGGNANQGLGNDFNQRQTVHHRQPGGNGMSGSAQTVNHGTNFFNFYFVNSGAYDLNFAGNGFQGLGGQASEQQQVPQHNQAHNRAPTGMFSTGTQFPSQSGPTHAAPNPGLYATAGPSTSSNSIRPVPLHAQPTYANAGTSMTPGRAFQPYAYGGGNAIQHGTSYMGPVEPHNHFCHYRQAEHGFRSYSQSSLDEDVFEDEDHPCSQSSQKSLSRGGIHNHPFQGFQQ